MRKTKTKAATGCPISWISVSAAPPPGGVTRVKSQISSGGSDTSGTFSSESCQQLVIGASLGAEEHLQGQELSEQPDGVLCAQETSGPTQQDLRRPRSLCCRDVSQQVSRLLEDTMRSFTDSDGVCPPSETVTELEEGKESWRRRAEELQQKREKLQVRKLTSSRTCSRTSSRTSTRPASSGLGAAGL